MEVLGILWLAARLPLYLTWDALNEKCRRAVERCRARCAQRYRIGHSESIRCKLCNLGEFLWWKWYEHMYARWGKQETGSEAEDDCGCGE